MEGEKKEVQPSVEERLAELEKRLKDQLEINEKLAQQIQSLEQRMNKNHMR